MPGDIEVEIQIIKSSCLGGSPRVIQKAIKTKRCILFGTFVQRDDASIIAAQDNRGFCVQRCLKYLLAGDIKLGGVHEHVGNPMYSTGVGLIIHALHQQEDLGMSAFRHGRKLWRVVEHMKSWAREFF